MKGLKCMNWNRRMIAGVLAVLMTMSPLGQVAGAATITSKTEPTALELTVQDAVDLAMKNNDSIKTAALNKENAELSRSSGQKQYSQSLVDGPKGSNQALDISIYSLKVKDLTEEIAGITYDYTKEAVAVGVQKLYWNVLLKQSAIEVAEAKLAYAEKQYRAAQLKQTVGLLTQTSVLQCKTAVESAKASLTSAEGDLKNAVDSLKKQMGVQTTTEIILTEELPEFIPVDIEDIEYYASKMALNAPTLKIQDKTVDLNEYNEKMGKAQVAVSVITGVTYSQEDTERQSEIGTENAKLNKLTTEKDLKETVRTLYNSTLTMEANYETLKQSMLTAEEALKTKQQMYELGMATQLEVLEAQNTCASLEDQYKQVVIGHAINKLSLEHPWC